jgi:hypothetical protein
MWPPPLLASRPPGLQIVIAVVLPAAFGLVVGILLGISAGAYTVLSLVGILGGIGAGYDHADVLEGAGRGFAGGMLFGTFILLGHALEGSKAKTDIPSPHIVLPIATTIFGITLGAIGGALRARRDRRTRAPVA